MKLKRFIPSIILLLLSCIFITGVTVYGLVDNFTSEYPIDPQTKIELALKQETFLALIIVAVAWVGVGVDALLSRIKDGSKRKFVSLSFYLGSFFVCIVLPLLSIALIYGIFSTGDGWQQLPAPPETPVAIAAGGPSSVVIETQDGNYYYCVVNNDLCWQPENKPSDIVIGGADSNTYATGNIPASAPPGQVVDMLAISHSNGPVHSESHYAILNDGTVWVLNREVNNYSGGFMAGLSSILILPLVAASVVLFIGAGLGTLTRWLAGRIWREPKTE